MLRICLALRFFSSSGYPAVAIGLDAKKIFHTDTNRAVILGGSTANNPGVYGGSAVVTAVAVKEARKERRAFRVAGIELIGLMQALIQCHLPEMKEFRNSKFLRCAAQTVCSQAQSRRTPPSDKGGNGQHTCSTSTAARAGYRLAADAGK